jgi:antitoxin component of MazEF toxin-antitoxin module
MKTRHEEWDDNLGLRIPKSLATAARLRANSTVDLSILKETLGVKPVSPQRLTLEELLRGITEGNISSERDSGPAMSKDVVPRC